MVGVLVVVLVAKVALALKSAYIHIWLPEMFHQPEPE
jgi:hypothetical protein